MIRRLPYGKSSKLANAVDMSPQMLGQVISGRKSVTAPVADRLAEVTKSNFRIWLKGGDVIARQEAIDRWAILN